jgi:hypothetical protein
MEFFKIQQDLDWRGQALDVSMKKRQAITAARSVIPPPKHEIHSVLCPDLDPCKWVSFQADPIDKSASEQILGHQNLLSTSRQLGYKGESRSPHPDITSGNQIRQTTTKSTNYQVSNCHIFQATSHKPAVCALPCPSSVWPPPAANAGAEKILPPHVDLVRDPDPDPFR